MLNFTTKIGGYKFLLSYGYQCHDKYLKDIQNALNDDNNISFDDLKSILKNDSFPLCNFMWSFVNDMYDSFDDNDMHVVQEEFILMNEIAKALFDYFGIQIVEYPKDEDK